MTILPVATVATGLLQQGVSTAVATVATGLFKQGVATAVDTVATHTPLYGGCVATVQTACASQVEAVAAIRATI